MPVFHVFIINRAGSLIYDFDCSPKAADVDRTLTYPLDFKLELIDQRITVVFGERDRDAGIRVGNIVTSINGSRIGQNGKFTTEVRGEDGSVESNDCDVLEYLQNADNFPLNARFGRPSLTTNEKIILSSMFHSLYAIGAQLSPVAKSTGIKVIDTDQFRLQCFQTTTGNKFVLIADPQTPNLEHLLRRIYEIYSDYALKNPFYSIDMPIRCELFDIALQQILDKFDKTGIVTV